MNLESILNKVKDFSGIDFILPKDPVTGKRSVTLLFTLVSFLFCILASSLFAYGKIKNTGDFKEIFYASLATYLGRRITGSKGEVIENENAK
jgi:hypothetical protein